jgi:hypothetical protein
MKKAQRHEAIRERARGAVLDLYHNATPSYPRCDAEDCNPSCERCEAFNGWFEDVARFEIEYLNDGGAYGSSADYRRVLMHDANAGKYKSAAARAYYVRWKLREMHEERARCNRLDSRTTRLVNAQWERVREEFGELYQWGRGGRTLAPKDLVKQRGGSSFAMIEDAFDEKSIAATVDVVLILESFNAYVESWCKGVPEMWREHVREEADEGLEENAVRSNN